MQETPSEETLRVLDDYHRAKAEEYKQLIGGSFGIEGFEPHLVSRQPFHNLMFYSAIAKSPEQKYIMFLDFNWNYEDHEPLRTKLGLDKDMKVGHRGSIHVVATPIASHSSILSYYSKIKGLDELLAITKGGFIKIDGDNVSLERSSDSFGKDYGLDSCHGIAAFVLKTMFPHLNITTDDYATLETALKEGEDYALLFNQTTEEARSQAHQAAKFLQAITRRGFQQAMMVLAAQEE